MLVSPITAAGSALFRNACLEGSGNVVISPLSVVVAMSMAAAGSGEGHPAGEEIRSAMHHHLVAGKASDAASKEKATHAYFKELLTGMQTDPKVEVLVANSVWAAGDVLQEYKDVCKDSFNAQAMELKPGSAATINQWVATSTKDMIKKLLDEDPMGPAVLLNAVYFKGVWTETFDIAKTKQGEFTKFDGTKTPCMLMDWKNKKTQYVETPTEQIVSLSYGSSNRFRGIVILPKEEGAAGMQKTVDALFTDPAKFQDVLADITPENVIMALPRFKVDFGPKSLKSVLQEMGVKAGFEQTQGFLRLSKDPTAFIREVLHKAVIEVNEEGTVAAAATAVVMTRSLPPPANMVVCDRPFLFAVFDSKSNTMVFVSRVEIPELPLG